MSIDSFLKNFNNGFMFGALQNSFGFGCFGGFGNWFSGAGCGFSFNGGFVNNPISSIWDLNCSMNWNNLNSASIFRTNTSFGDSAFSGFWDNVNLSGSQNIFGGNNFGSFWDNYNFGNTTTTTTETKESDKKKAVTSETGSSKPTSYNSIIAKYAKEYGVEEAFIKAVIRQESSFDSKAVSTCGAQGLMQLMPDTAKDMGVTDSFDPEQNIKGGVKYLKMLLNKYGSKEAALHAYNMGMGNYAKGKRNYAYVNKIMNYYNQYKASA